MSPCIGCKYFGTCGDLKRTKPCSGRVESKKEMIKYRLDADLWRLQKNI